MEDQKDGRRHAKSLKGRYVGSLEGGHARSPKEGTPDYLIRGQAGPVDNGSHAHCIT